MSQFIDRSEITEIEALLDALNEFQSSSKCVSLGDLEIFDRNGDLLGTIKDNYDRHPVKQELVLHYPE